MRTASNYTLFVLITKLDGIWRRALETCPEIPNPQGHGWTIDKDGNLDIVWMNGSSAPDVVLQFLSCDCSRSCKLPGCPCMENKLKCTAACKLHSGSNMTDEDEEIQIQESTSDDENSDEADEVGDNNIS